MTKKTEKELVYFPWTGGFIFCMVVYAICCFCMEGTSFNPLAILVVVVIFVIELIATAAAYLIRK